MKNKKYILLLIASLLVVIILGVTYAWLIQTVNSNKIQAMRVGTFKLSLEEGNSLSLPSSEFMSDEDGLKQDGFTFSVANTGKFTGSYSVYLDDDSINSDQTRLNDKYIKYNLEVNGTKGNSVALNNRKIYEGTLAKGKTDSFVLRIWLNKDVNGDIGGQVFKVKLRIEVNQEITPTPVAEKLLAGVGSNGSIDTSDSEQTFITGTNPNNYIWYSGKLWRAVSIDTSDNSVKLITQWDISIISYNVVGNSLFKGSYMEQWLNDTTVDGFLENLREPEKFIKMDSVWNNTITTETTKPAKTTLVTDAVGLLNMYEYTMSLKNADYKTGYLNNGLNWWTMTPSDSNNIYLVNDYGVAPTMYSSRNTFGIRPVINLKSNIKIVSGNGTKDSPYRLEGDNDKTLSGTLLSRRYSGEYISFGTSENNLYRIVSHENGNGTKITSAFPLKENGTFKTITYGDNSIFSVNNNIGQYLNSQSYLLDNSKNMIIESNWYLGKFNDGYNYKLAKYKSSDMTELNEYVTAKVGLLRVGELMCGHFDNRYSNNSYWTITKEDDANVRGISVTGYTRAYSFSDTDVAIKPAMNLKSNVVITGGDGTKSNPFTIALNR